MLQRNSIRPKSQEEAERALTAIISDVRNLLTRIEDAVPLINLAITTSGVNLSAKLSGTISPSRLLQASTFLTSADSNYAAKPGRQQVGPTYILSLYMLFAGHASRPVDDKGIRQTTWKEVIHKAKVRLVRVPLEQLYDVPGEQTLSSDGLAGSIPREANPVVFAYQLLIIEDLDDDRVHAFEDNETQDCEDVANAGIRDVVPVHEVSKIFYADTGKILNIGGDSDTNSPVLLLKRDVHAESTRRLFNRSQQSYGFQDCPAVNGSANENDTADEQSKIDDQLHWEFAKSSPCKVSQASPGKAQTPWRLPADLDPEWMAFEVYVEDQDFDSDPESGGSFRLSSSRADSPDPNLISAVSKLTLKAPSTTNSPTANNHVASSASPGLHISPSKRTNPAIKSSLSLLEMLLKLTALQQFRQDTHLSIEDELLNFFLEDSSTAGAGPDKVFRQRLRHDAMRRVGFDPYDESPIKRRGEEYIDHARGAASPQRAFDPATFEPSSPENETWKPVQASIESTSPVSPSPHLVLPRQTPSSSNKNLGRLSEGRRSAVQSKYGTQRASSPASLIATPPSTTSSKLAYLGMGSEMKGRSSIGTELFVPRDEVVDGSLHDRDGTEERETAPALE